MRERSRRRIIFAGSTNNPSYAQQYGWGLLALASVQLIVRWRYAFLFLAVGVWYDMIS